LAEIEWIALGGYLKTGHRHRSDADYAAIPSGLLRRFLASMDPQLSVEIKTVPEQVAALW
jgi:hypothetical protein